MGGLNLAHLQTQAPSPWPDGFHQSNGILWALLSSQAVKTRATWTAGWWTSSVYTLVAVCHSRRSLCSLIGTQSTHITLRSYTASNFVCRRTISLVRIVECNNYNACRLYVRTTTTGGGDMEAECDPPASRSRWRSPFTEIGELSWTGSWAPNLGDYRSENVLCMYVTLERFLWGPPRWPLSLDLALVS